MIGVAARIPQAEPRNSAGVPPYTDAAIAMGSSRRYRHRQPEDVDLLAL